MQDPLVTIILLTWNSRKDIDECLISMLKQDYSNYHILIVDSCSTDGTPEYIRVNYPELELVEMSQNMGYRKGNSYGMKLAKGKYAIVCNDDVKVENNWMSEMVKTMEKDNSIGLVTPMILMEDKPWLINTAGNTLHFSGMYGPRAKGENRQKQETPQTLASVSGCCFMIRKDILIKLGGFSADFDNLDVGWHASFEDVDLCWRAQMLGYRIEYVPSAIMYHSYKQPKMFPSRFASYEWGRYLVVIRNFSLTTLLLLLPFLVVLDLMAWVYAFSKGRAHIASKALVMKWLIRHPYDILKMRQRIQALRKVSDYHIMSKVDYRINLNQTLGGGSGAFIINCVFGFVSFFYYHILMVILKGQDIFYNMLKK